MADNTELARVTLAAKRELSATTISRLFTTSVVTPNLLALHDEVYVPIPTEHELMFAKAKVTNAVTTLYHHDLASESRRRKAGHDSDSEGEDAFKRQRVHLGEKVRNSKRSYALMSLRQEREIKSVAVAVEAVAVLNAGNELSDGEKPEVIEVFSSDSE